MCHRQINTLKHIYNDISEIPKEEINNIPDSIFTLISKQTVRVFDTEEKLLAAGMLSIGKVMNGNLKLMITSLIYPHNISIFSISSVIATQDDNIYVQYNCTHCGGCKCSQ